MKQEYDKYTEEDHKVWSLMFAEQMGHLPEIVTKAYLEGSEKVQFKPDRVPRFDVINEVLGKLTGWQAYVVPGIVDNDIFFDHLDKKEFPATTWLRTMAQLKYIEEPDMFHDVFGHIPLLAEPDFCEFLSGLASMVMPYLDNPMVVELVTRIYWYTVEFGLIQEDGQVKIYGAGLISSPGESRISVSPESIKERYDVACILETGYIKETYQSKYFVIDSYKQLYDSLPEVKRQIQEYLEGKKTLATS